MSRSPTIATAAAGARSIDAFQDADRHSRRVAALRVLTPAVAGAVVAAAVIAAILQPLSSEIHVDISGVVAGGASVAMAAPRMRGFNSQDRAYDVTAKTARQTIATPDRIALDELSAEVELAGGGYARMTSPAGLYDAGSQVLTLDGAVRVVSDKGDDARLTGARAELKTGRIASDQPVEIRLDRSRLSADRMEILDSGDRILFSGRVRLTLSRSRTDASASSNGADGGPGSWPQTP